MKKIIEKVFMIIGILTVVCAVIFGGVLFFDWRSEQKKEETEKKVEAQKGQELIDRNAEIQEALDEGFVTIFSSEDGFAILEKEDGKNGYIWKSFSDGKLWRVAEISTAKRKIVGRVEDALVVMYPDEETKQIVLITDNLNPDDPVQGFGMFGKIPMEKVGKEPEVEEMKVEGNEFWLTFRNDDPEREDKVTYHGTIKTHIVEKKEIETSFEEVE